MRTIYFEQSVQQNKKKRETYIVQCMLSEKRLQKTNCAYSNSTFVMMNHRNGCTEIIPRTLRQTFHPNFWVLCTMRLIPECYNQSYSYHCHSTLLIDIATCQPSCLLVIILICGQRSSRSNSTIVCNFKNNACHLLHNRYVADRVLFSLEVLVKAHKQQYIQVQLYSVTSKLFQQGNYFFINIEKYL